MLNNILNLKGVKQLDQEQLRNTRGGRRYTVICFYDMLEGTVITTTSQTVANESLAYCEEQGGISHLVGGNN